MTTAPTLTSPAAERVARANADAERSLRIWKWGLGFLVGGNLVLALLDALVGNVVALIPMLLVWVLLVLATAFLWLMTKGQHLTWSAGYNSWKITNGVWLGGTALFALLSTCAGTLVGAEAGTLALSAGLPALVAVALPVTYLFWLRHMGRKLRQSVLSGLPINLLYLRVFGPATGTTLMASMVSPVWYFAGSVQFLRGSYLTSEVRWIPSILLLGQEDKYVTETPDELAAAIRSFKLAPNWTGMYAQNSLLCSDSMWQLALDTLLADTDVALMNLCGFSRERRGCAFELDQLVDRLPTRRWLLLVDPSTDLQYLEEVLQESWNAMVPDSPNRAADVAPVQIFRLASPETAAQDALALLKALTAVPTIFGSPGTEEEIENRHAEASRLFEILCAGAPSS